MARVLVFTAVMTALVIIISFTRYKSLSVENKPFNYEEAKQVHMAFVKTLEELEKAKHQKEEVVEEVEEKPLVELTTPQLVKGSELYAKCIACHGRRGEGKKSQKAPKIGGQHPWYIKASVLAMQSGERQNKVMEPFIRTLSVQDVDDLAAYISKLPWKSK